MFLFPKNIVYFHFLGCWLLVVGCWCYKYIFFLQPFKVIFIMDIFINFRTAWLNPSGELEFNQKDAAKDYCTSWLLLDFGAFLDFV